MATSVGRFNIHPMSDEIDELKRKIALLDGDQKAFVENARIAKRQNQEKILAMREENKRSHALLASMLVGDEKVVSSAFHETRKKQPPSFRDMKSASAIERFDQRACELEKMLNRLKHETAKRQKKLAALNTKVSENAHECEAGRQHDDGQSAAARELRQLENRLDKVVIRSQEAMQIQETYHQVISHMKQERLHYDNRLKALGKVIQEKQRTYREMASIRNDAELAQSTAKAELQKEETRLMSTRRHNEQSLVTCRLAAEEREKKKRMEEEDDDDDEDDEKKKKRKKKKEEKPVERALPPIEATQPDVEPVPQEAPTLLPENMDQQKLAIYEEQLARIKEVTGVTNEQEVIERFLTQDKTTEHLERLKEMNQTQLSDLRTDKADLEKQFEDLKYSGEAKISSGQKLLEEFKEHLDDGKKKERDTQESADRTTKLLLDVNAGILHLQEKVHLLRAPKPSIPVKHPPPNADDYMVDVLSTVEQKLVRLLEELDGQNLEQLKLEIDETQLRSAVDGKGQDQNIRIPLKTSNNATGSSTANANEATAQQETEEKKQTFRKYDEESGEDDDGVFTRQALKRQSQQLVDAKTKKKRRRRAKDD